MCDLTCHVIKDVHGMMYVLQHKEIVFWNDNIRKRLGVAAQVEEKFAQHPLR
jgi:hypothetical protein